MAKSAKQNIIGILAAVGLALVSLLVFPLYVTPLGFVWFVALMFLKTKFGNAPAFVGGVLLAAVVFLIFGNLPALFMLCVAVLPLIAASLAMRPGARVETIALYIFVSMMAVIFGAIAIVSATHGDVITLIVEYVRTSFAEVEAISPGLWDAYFELSGLDVTADEFIYNLIYDFEVLLRERLIGQIISYCVFASAFGILAARRAALKSGEAEKYGLNFDLFKWVLPKYTGRMLIPSAAAFYMLSEVVPKLNLLSGAYALWSLAYSLFVLQGIVHLAFVMKAKGSGAGWRATLITALFLVLMPALFVSGLMDRLVPFRRQMPGTAPAKGATLEEILKQLSGEEDDDNENNSNNDKNDDDE